MLIWNGLIEIAPDKNLFVSGKVIKYSGESFFQMFDVCFICGGIKTKQEQHMQPFSEPISFSNNPANPLLQPDNMEQLKLDGKIRFLLFLSLFFQAFKVFLSTKC